MSSLVSIITPIYNSARFLNDALTSVIRQDHADWELLLVDDGSQDNSREIANGWCRHDRRLTLLTHPHNENRGSSATRNLGIHRSRGALIAFLDADDVWLPGKLELQIAILNAHPEAAMTTAAAERWYTWDPTHQDAPDFTVPSAIPGWGADRIIPPPHLVNAFLADESLTPCTCTVLARREAVLRAGAWESAFRGLYDDQVFYAKLALHQPVYVASACLARYRQRPDSCCATAMQNRSAEPEHAHFLRWLEQYKTECVHSR